MKKLVPGFLYNTEYPQGKSFTNEDEYLTALAGDWWEHPSEIGKPKEEITKKRGRPVTKYKGYN